MLNRKQPRDFTPHAVPVTTVPINLGLGPAPEYIGYIYMWFGPVAGLW